MNILGKPDEMNFLEHLEELRWKIVKAISTLIIFSIVLFWQSDRILMWLKFPLWKLDQQPDIVYLKPAGMFMVKTTIAMVGGFICSLPVIFYQLWSFVSPGLYLREKKFVYLILASTILCFITGFAFAFFIILPLGLKFLLSMTIEGIKPQLEINEYIGFVVQLVLVFGLVFQLPIISIILAKMGLLTHTFMSRIRPYAIVVIFILAGILTPPDVISQLLMAAPLLILYEVSILLIRFFKFKRS